MKFLLLSFVLFSASAYAQNTNRIYHSVAKNDSCIEVKTTDGSYFFSAYSDKVIETTFIPKGERFLVESHAVVQTKTKNLLKFKESKTALRIFSKGIQVIITKQPFQLSYYYQGELLTSEKNGYYKDSSYENIDFNLAQEEILFGGGARALGMNRRGYKLELYNKAHYGYETHSELMNYTLPIVVSSKKYMLHFDNAPIGFLDLDSKKNNTLTYQTISGRKTYQLIAGNEWEDLITAYTNLTGHQPLPPRWAFGNFASRFGYHSEAETRNVVNQFKKDSIPLDAIILDLYWFGKEIQGTLGNLAFYTDSFPTAKKMIDDFHAQHIETILITEPFILTTSNRWKEAVDKDILGKDALGNPFTYNFYFGNTGLIDIYNPKGANWFWNIYKDLHEMGINGFWGDLGEPEVHPKELMHFNHSANEVHNVYGHDWARLLSDGFKREFPSERPFILMRSGAAGSQRYGLIPWSGDVNRTWGGLQSQMEISLQMGLQGIGYMHSDLGGFAGANDDPELYVRWLQYGVFQPIFRPHGQEQVASEAIFKDEKTKALAKEAIQLRYSLLPYNYSLAYKNSTTGIPLMRPIFYEAPFDSTALEINSTYMWGDAFLVTPITTANCKRTNVYFPRNSVWFDFYTDQKYEINENSENSTLTIAVANDHIPVFVKAGSFIPMTSNLYNTNDYNAENLQLHFYYDESLTSSSAELYEDNGKDAKAVETKNYALTRFNYLKKKKHSSIQFVIESNYNKEEISRPVEIIIHNVDKCPKALKLGKNKLDYNYDINTKTLKTNILITTIESKLVFQIH
jgi:alpha-glucosidase (family GH31 glycosyl hydrolase)